MLSPPLDETALALGYFLSIAIWLAFERTFGAPRLREVSHDALEATEEAIKLEEELRAAHGDEPFDLDDVVSIEQPNVLAFVHEHVDAALDPSKRSGERPHPAARHRRRRRPRRSTAAIAAPDAVPLARRPPGRRRVARQPRAHGMKTEAIVLHAHGGPEVLVRETIELPEPGPREVRVRVRAVALNHLDLWVRRGMPGLKLSFPHRLGSDVVGEVDALGPGARGVRVGERVVVNPGLSCGVCERCLSGRDSLCRKYAILGEHTSGGYARHVVVPDANLLP